ncbi:hypothetical protein COT60_03475 [Candidatus Pacearchaeota archaeon CG09_land_8_20_14_0_10_30_9]|nr:MAG: hypothetical protein COT60_03475 [Candidatus Pacearchaeota archaeon CG09_land_8_20_14_0_10_30_9]
MPFKDLEKRKEYRRNWYKLNSFSEKRHVKQRKEKLKKWIEEYKSRLKCLKCRETHPSTIDFHHKDGRKKEISISKMVSEGYSMLRIKKEIEKCQILCSNCHRKLHWKKNKF